MSFWSSSSKNTEQNFLVLDISSGTVGGAVVIARNDRNFTIKNSYRELIPFNRSLVGKDLHPSMLSALKIVCKNLSIGAGKIDTVHFVLSSPWIVSESKTIVHCQNKPFIVSSKFINELIDNDEAGLRNEYFDVVEVERNITDFKINGYSITEPHGKKANKLEISSFSSSTSSELLSELKKAVHSAFPVSNFETHSMNLLSLLALRDITRNSRDFAFINVHGEATDVIGSSRNHLSGMSSVPIGTRTILRGYASNLNMSHHLAISEMSLRVSETLVNDAAGHKSSLINDLHRQWSEGVSSVILELYATLSKPSIFYVYADMSLENTFSTLFRKDVLKGLRLSRESTEIQTLTDTRLSSLIHTLGGRINDELLALLILGLSRKIK